MSFNGFTPVPLSYASSSKLKATHYMYVRVHESSKSSKKRKEKAAAATPAAHPFVIGGGLGTCFLFIITYRTNHLLLV
jgi:small neutral amino acid transporter SnatA (MarC family)